jgi:short-subunit dehydrogenase
MKDVKYLINAAGVFSPKVFLEHTGEDYDSYMDLNKATFFVTQQVYLTGKDLLTRSYGIAFLAKSLASELRPLRHFAWLASAHPSNRR